MEQMAQANNQTTVQFVVSEVFLFTSVGREMGCKLVAVPQMATWVKLAKLQNGNAFY